MEELKKSCSTCKKELPYSFFYPHKRMKLGLQPNCKVCSRQWHKDRPDYVKKKNALYKEKNPTYHTDWQRKKKYGISKEQVNDLRKRQDGKCAGCLSNLLESKECVDHCHLTGSVRGILCNSCNLILGYAKDEVGILTRLISYLEAENY